MNDDNSFTADGFTVSSSSETSEEIQKSLFEDTAPSAPEERVGAAPDSDATGFSGPEPDDDPESESPTVKDDATEAEKPLGKNNKSRHDPTERVKQALREKKEAQENAEYARKERDEISARANAAQEELTRLKASMAPKAPAAEGKPKSDDFESWEDYTEALTEWKVQEIRKVDQESAVKARMEHAKGAMHDDFGKRMAARLSADPSIRERISGTVLQLRPLSVLGENEPKGPLNLLAEQFIRSPLSAELMMYFSENESELQRFSTLHPLRFGVELGKIEGRFDAASVTATAPTETSKANPPVRPVTGGPATGEREPNDDAPFEEHLRFHNARDRVNAR